MEIDKEADRDRGNSVFTMICGKNSNRDVLKEGREE